MGMKIHTNELSHMAKMAAMPYMVKTFIIILLQDQLTNDHET